MKGNRFNWLIVAALLLGGLCVACQQASSPDAAIDAGDYKPLDPEELQCALQGFSYEVEIGEGGKPLPPRGHIGRFFCAEKEIPLLKNEVDRGFIVTRDFGKIKMEASASVTRSEIYLFVTDRQLKALKEYVGS